MKRMALAVCLIIQAWAVAPRSQSNNIRPGPEYDVLNAWAGDWVMKGEAKDTPSGPAYKVYWTLKGQRILGGFFLQVPHPWKAKGTVQNGLEITGYDPTKKSCMTHISWDDGSWIISTPTFTSERTCIENVTMYFPDGTVQKWRDTWNFSADRQSLLMNEEHEKDGTWWVAIEFRGVRGPKK